MAMVVMEEDMEDMEVTVEVMEDMVVMDVKGDLPKPTTDMVGTEAVMEVTVAADMEGMVGTDMVVNTLFSVFNILIPKFT